MSVSAGLQSALDLKRAGSMDDALIALEGVLGQAPNHPAALANLAEVQLRRNRPQEAAEALDRAEAAATWSSLIRIRRLILHPWLG